jgi:hypothetical protein
LSGRLGMAASIRPVSMTRTTRCQQGSGRRAELAEWRGEIVAETIRGALQGMPENVVMELELRGTTKRCG